MAETNINVTPGSGGPNIDLFTVDNGNARQAVIIGDPTTAANVALVDATKGLSVYSFQRPADLVISTTGAAAAGVTATLPSVSSQYHYITLIEIVKYATAAITGTATPVVVTTTNLAGSLAFTFDTAAAIGTSISRLYTPTSNLKSSASGTPTTIVCPATTSVIWRVNVYYYTAP